LDAATRKKQLEKNNDMRTLHKLTMLLFPCLALATALGQAETQKVPDINPVRQPAEAAASLLDLGMQIQETKLDCTHFVHYLYEQAGLAYDYVDSEQLYRGTESFRRVSQPESGDVIVWRGHAGIVVDPEEHTFLSALRDGVRTAAYDSPYWKGKGTPRFFHHLALTRQTPPKLGAPNKQIVSKRIAPRRTPPKRIIVVEASDDPNTGTSSDGAE
jgi:hypothetical protein